MRMNTSGTCFAWSPERTKALIVTSCWKGLRTSLNPCGMQSSIISKSRSFWSPGRSLCRKRFAAQAICSGLESAGQPAFSSFNKTLKKKKENKKRYLTIIKWTVFQLFFSKMKSLWKVYVECFKLSNIYDRENKVLENFGFENFPLAEFTCKSVRCNLNTSSTIAEAGLNLSSRAFSFTNFMILAAVTAPGSEEWLWALTPAWKVPSRWITVRRLLPSSTSWNVTWLFGLAVSVSSPRRGSSMEDSMMPGLGSKGKMIVQGYTM